MHGPVSSAAPSTTTRLGNWYAKPLFWHPQYAIFISEATFLPVFALLAPASSLADRFPDELATTLRALRVPEPFIQSELLAMNDVSVSKTNSRRLVGILNELSTMAKRIRDFHPELTPIQITMELARVPLGLSGGDWRIPEDSLRDLTRAD